MWTFLSYFFAIAAGVCIGFWLAAAMAYKKIRHLEEEIAALLTKQRMLKKNQCDPKCCIFYLSYKKGKGAA